ncbi:MAG TPA: hypothetical protein VJT08_11220 [Terriglobales bacterium]|nr:hypothetical protein [Terriglobales bacterium]
MRKPWSLLLLFLLSCSVSLFAGDDKEKKDNDQNVTVHARDYCDPVSFAAIGCGRDTSAGFITLSGFMAELAAEKSVGAWRFVTSPTKAEEGANVTVSNLGGETHTFTRVKKFGGGFVAGLNAASGNPDPAPECAQIVGGKLVPQPPGAGNIFLPAGTSATAQVNEGEVAHFQCCIHPWMRTTIDTRDNDDKDRDQDKGDNNQD